MRGVEPRLKRLPVIPISSVPTVHAELKGHVRLIPIPLLGDGMARLLSLAVSTGNAEVGIVLVDQIKNGLHHTVMRKVWNGIAQFA